MIAFLIGRDGQEEAEVSTFEDGPAPIVLQARQLGAEVETATFLLVRPGPREPLYLEVRGSRRRWPAA